MATIQSVDRIAGDFGQGITLIFSGVSLESSTVIINVLRPDKSRVTWTIDPANVNPVLSRATYVFADGDLPSNVKGPYRLQAVVTRTVVPLRRTKTVPFLLEVGESI